MQRREFSTIRRSHTTYVLGTGVVSDLRNWLRAPGSKIHAVITERCVWNLYGSKIEKALAPAEARPLFVDGEVDKTLTRVLELVEELGSVGVHRRQEIIVLGGGACCDVAGLVAMLYMRGVPYVLIPTSLMAQVDAAVGGKVGVNSLFRKNAIGGFYHPVAVLTDPQFLATLPEKFVSAGLAEVVKIDVIRPELRIAALLARLESSREMVSDRNAEALKAMIRLSQTAKLDLLEADPFEANLSRELNLGHAVAHALEKSSAEPIAHGEAVGVGLAATARYAVSRGFCTNERARSILATLRRFGLATEWKYVEQGSLLSRLEEIADHRGGSMRLVVPSSDPPTKILDTVDLQLLVGFVITGSGEHVEA